MSKKQKIEVTSDMLQEVQKKATHRPASEWMKDPKYSLVLGCLVDYVYSMQIKPTISDLVEMVNGHSKDQKFTKREIEAYIRELKEEGLITDGTDHNAIVVRGYKVIRLGKIPCVNCGEEMTYLSDKDTITKTNKVKQHFKCGSCKTTAVFTTQAIVEPTS